MTHAAAAAEIAPPEPGTTPEKEPDAPARARVKPSPKTVIFPRRVDRIATEAHGRFVVVMSAALVATLVWASLTEIDKVTRGSGRIVPQVHKQEVQHLEGGIVGEIFVKEGDKVTPGQALMRIENSFFISELAQAHIELVAKRVRLARLDAERSGADHVDFPDDMKAARPEQVREETQLFAIRHSNLRQQTDILEQQHKEKEIELSALRSREPSYLRQREIAEARLASLQKLSAAGAASTNERLSAESDYEQSLTRLSDLMHDVPHAQASIEELEKRKQQVLSQFQADAEKERSQTATDIEKLSKSIEAMQDRIRRSDVIAPIGGVINKLNVNTVGGVVKPGESLIEIVPSDTSIGVEMKLTPSDRAEVWPGQKALVKVSAYEYSSYGGLPAKVLDISPDALTDERGAPYFRVRLEADVTRFGAEHPVLPGMLADVDVIGQRESVLASVLKPLRHVKDNALRQ